VLASSADSEKLANALISDDLKGTAPDAEKAAQPGSPLRIDSSRGTLLADQRGSVPQLPKTKQGSDCAADGDRKQLTPLGANDVRSGASGSAC
jgi:hypothetical protein